MPQRVDRAFHRIGYFQNQSRRGPCRWATGAIGSRKSGGKRAMLPLPSNEHKWAAF
jgi:hypothetical protein